MTKAFSLTVTSLDTGNRIIFENSSFICNYRFTILDTASKLGGTIIDEYTITMPNYNKYSDLLLFISTLERNVFSLTLDGNDFKFYKKTSLIERSWNSITAHAKYLGGIPNLTGGFDFKDPITLNEFIEYIHSIELMEEFNPKTKY